MAAAPCPPALLAEAGKVATLRRLPASWRPQCELLPLPSLEARLARKLEQELPVPPRVFLEVLQRLGFVPPDPQLYPKVLSFYTSQVLGFYEPHQDTMVVVDRPLPEDNQAGALWAHELAHAAQEKRFRLPSKLLAIKNNSDQQRAYSAVAEGEAMLVMLALASQGPLDTQQVRRTAEAIAAGTRSWAQQAGIGPFFVEDLAFPYAQGLATVLAAWEKGGWQAVDQLLARPPQCTAALLFQGPCRHLDERLLPPVPEGTQELLLDTLGAWAVRFWLGLALPPEEAERVARLWDGDRLRLVAFQAQPSRWAMAWQLRVAREKERPHVQASLGKALPALLQRFNPDRVPVLAFRSQGAVLTVLVDWPTTQP